MDDSELRKEAAKFSLASISVNAEMFTPTLPPPPPLFTEIVPLPSHPGL